MASPQRLVSKLQCVSPRPMQSIPQIRRFLSPKSPVREVCKKEIENTNRLSPFNVDTPSRKRILNYGLPSKRRTILGSGSFATVYKASYKGDQVAAKIIETRRGSDGVMNSEKRASFLRHSNIVKVLTIERGTSVSLITMELCGPTLQDRLEENELPKEQRIRILRDIACALQFCHKSRIVHADVKPKNILIAEDGQPKLTDFGSSILMDEPYNANEFHGTPGYAAPEILKGDTPTPAADVYSLGVVAWQMISRKVPFIGLHIHTVIYLSAKGMRPSDDLDDGFNGKYKILYRKMWSQCSEERPLISEVIDKVDNLI